MKFILFVPRQFAMGNKKNEKSLAKFKQSWKKHPPFAAGLIL